MAGAFLRSEAGAGMVEFAIAAFFFTLVLLGIFEFGLAAWAKNSVASAAREGTRFAVVRGKDSGLAASTTADVVRDYVRSKSALSPITVTTVWADADKKPDTKVTVTVSYNYKRVGLIIPNRTLTSSSAMRIVF
jgi:Flp pilus assembly protein TadG